MAHGSGPHHKELDERRGVQRCGATVCAWKGCGTRLNLYNRRKYCSSHLPRVTAMEAIDDSVKRAAYRQSYRDRTGV